jgi:phytoene synthase
MDSGASGRYPRDTHPCGSLSALPDTSRGSRRLLQGDLERYCHYVAGTVGLMLAGLFGTTDPAGDTKMAMLGRAMQRTNILRDIDEDLAAGRLYLPRTAIDRYGYPAPGAREELLKDQIARADALYEEGLDAIEMLIHGRRAMGLSAILYREILRQIERDGFGLKPGRATVPGWRRQHLARTQSLILGESQPFDMPNQ